MECTSSKECFISVTVFEKCFAFENEHPMLPLEWTQQNDSTIQLYGLKT